MDLCLDVLKQCPGFTFLDIRGPCSFFSPLPRPVCASAVYSRRDAVPPPKGSDEPKPECPELDSNGALVDGEDEDPIQTPSLDLDRLPILRTVE